MGLAPALLLSAAAGAQAPDTPAAPAFANPALASAPVAASSFGHYQPKKAYAEQVSNSLYLPMRDGTKLAVRITRPAVNGKPVEGKFPVIWHHSLNMVSDPMDGTGPRAGGFRWIPSLTDHGYVVVQVARRGNGQSFGVRRGYHDRNETQDTFEVTEWLAAQPWSTGKIGMYGCSNTGDAAMQALTVRPPHLKAIFSGCFSWNKFDAFRRGGIFAQWGTGPSRTIEQDMAVEPVDGDADKTLLAQAAKEHQLATPLFDMWKGMPYRDSWSPLVQSRFWGEGSTSSYADAVRLSGAAVYVVGGWFDELRDQGLIAQGNLPGSRIVIGPWLHCYNDNFQLVEEAHRFFDQELKGIATGVSAEAPIHYYTINAEPGTEWRTSQVWPLANSKPSAFFLSDAGRLGPSRTGAGKGASFTVKYDLSCPEAGSGSTVQPCHVPGAGTSFAGPALKQALEVTGNPVADVWISTQAPDANVFLYLEDVAPDGTVRVVTEGRLRASLRKTDKAPWGLPGDYPWHRAYGEDAQPLKPGEPVRLQFDLMPTSYVFRPGHRIQFTVTGADHRERARAELTPAPVIRVMTDARHASRVTLPLVGA